MIADESHDLEALVLQQGAVAVVPLGGSAQQLAEVIQAAIAGTLDDVPIVRTPENAVYPGKDVGLSAESRLCWD
jgi:hypothetical protein